MEIVELMTIGGQVSSAGGMGGGVDAFHPAPIAEFFGGNVGPVLAAVAGNVDETVIAARPNQAFLDGRFRKSKNGVVILDAGVVLCERTAGGLLLAFVVAGEIAADGRPGHALVGGLKNSLAAVVESAGIVGRHHDGRGPLEAMLQVGVTGTHGIEGPGRNVLFLMIFLVEPGDQAVVGARIDNVGIPGIGNDEAGFAAADFVPIRAVDDAVIAAAGNRHG